MAKQNPMHSIAVGISTGLYEYKIIYCLHDGHFYTYDNGVWMNILPTELLGTICKHPKVIDLKIDTFPITTKKQILENLKLLVYKPLSDFNVQGWLNFPSGMIDPVTQEFHKHNEKNISTIRLPYNYDPMATCELWIKTLNEIFDNDQDKINISQEYFGYCLTRETNREKAILALGESRTGKSTYLHVLRHMVGIKNCSSVPIKFISNPQYTPLLINKLVNIDADVSGKASDFEAEFKVITSGEPVSCNQKFIPTFEFTPYCKLVMAANEFPRITDHSLAVYKRLILIPFERVFEESEININLKSELLKELPGILNWALAGLKRLNERGMFEHKDFMKDAVKDLENENNPTNLFFDEYLEIDFDEYIEKPFLYEKYKEWADKNKQYALSNVRFSMCMLKRFHKQTPKDARLSEGNRPRIWKNLKFIGSESKKQQSEEIQWQN